MDICQHYSFKYQYRKDADGTYAAFKSFLREAEAGGASEVLLLTGSGPKKEMNSLSCLQRYVFEKLSDSKRCKSTILQTICG